MHTITLIGKPGCHLCHKVKDIVQHVVGTQAVLIEEIDITGNAEMNAKYHDEIPVVLVDGVERFRHNVDPDKLAEFLGGGNILGIDH